MSLLTPGRNLVLIGLMGAGKSTVGRLLADRLGRPFVDTDALVEADAGRTVAEVFAAEGERGFRAREAAAVRHVSALRGQVVAVGGGAVLDPRNVTHLRATGDLVLLDAQPAVLADRLTAAEAAEDSRPLLAGAGDLTVRLDELRALRAEAYRTSATHAVDTASRTPERIAEEILAWAATRPGVLAMEERQL